jgi:hypothetical protein
MASVAITTRPTGANPTAIDGTQPTPINQHHQRPIQSGRIAIKPSSPVLVNIPPANLRLSPLLEPSQHIRRIVRRAIIRDHQRNRPLSVRDRPTPDPDGRLDRIDPNRHRDRITITGANQVDQAREPGREPDQLTAPITHRRQPPIRPQHRLNLDSPNPKALGRIG